MVTSVLWGVSYWKSENLPRLSPLTQIFSEPLQTAVTESSFHLASKAQDYTLQPLYDYDISGVVVSYHESDSWRDRVHKRWGDYINTKDLCVIWGKNLTSSYLSDLDFSHGEWTCYVKTSNRTAWENFDMNGLSNNHLIPANDSVSKIIAEARVGDEIHIKGKLVNYNVNGGPYRNTSITRDDRENGACEIIYVTGAQILKRHNIVWIELARVFKILTALSLLGILFCMFVKSEIKLSGL
jgi:hypothetical protein